MKREANMSDKCSNCGKEITENSTFCRHFEDVYCSHACVLKALHARYTNCESECVCDLCGLPHYPGETIIVSKDIDSKSGTGILKRIGDVNDMDVFYLDKCWD
jgi:hypothetical protein